MGKIVELAEKIEKQIIELDDKILEIKDKAYKETADVKEDVESKIDDYLYKKKLLEYKLQDMKDSSENAFDDLKQGLENSWEELRSAFQNAWERFNK